MEESGTKESTESAETPESAVREQPRNYFRIGMIGVLVALVAVWGYSQYQLGLLEVEAESLVEEHAAEFQSEDMEIVTDVTVSQDALIFGRANAKLEIFMRPVDSADAEKIRGVEYFYEQSDDGWRFVGSGSCTSEECVTKGYQAFASR